MNQPINTQSEYPKIKTSNRIHKVFVSLSIFLSVLPWVIIFTQDITLPLLKSFSIDLFNFFAVQFFLSFVFAILAARKGSRRVKVLMIIVLLLDFYSAVMVLPWAFIGRYWHWAIKFLLLTEAAPLTEPSVGSKVKVFASIIGSDQYSILGDRKLSVGWKVKAVKL